MEYTAEQKSAIDRSMTDSLVLMTGGPGTGKTTTIKGIVSDNESAGAVVTVLAPTGKAASRITDHTGFEASTIHRALEWFPPLQGFRRNAGNPLPADVVVVDESSMIDVHIAGSLMEAVRPDARLVMVGDANQLQPVGPGSPFADLLSVPQAKAIRLSRPFRQSGGSAIANAAYAILDGKAPDNVVSDESTFLYLERGTSDIAVTVMELIRERFPKRGICGDEAIQVLVPAKEKAVGTKAFNDMLAAHFNPSGRINALSVGDKVIQQVNDYDAGVFNGDTGRVTRAAKGAVVVEFADRKEVVYTGDKRSNIARAWALTVHKSQGSEYDAVIIAIDDAHGPLLYRNLLYTAVTRARRMAVVIGPKSAMRSCVATVATRRETNLPHRITSML